MPAALLIWVGLLWGFGFITGRMTEHVEPPNSIDAQIIEMKMPEKRIVVPVQPVRKAVSRTAPSQIPAPMRQPVTLGDTQSKPAEKPVMQPALPSTPAVSLPETNLPAGNQPSSVLIPPRGTSERGMLPKGTTGESISPPQFGAAYLNNPKPLYPASARRMGMEGTVMLKVLVSRDGGAVKIEIAQSSGHEILDKAAAEAVKNWRFVPARQGDSPLEEWVQVPVAFRLKK
jgi:protein TonB